MYGTSVVLSGYYITIEGYAGSSEKRRYIISIQVSDWRNSWNRCGKSIWTGWILGTYGIINCCRSYEQ